MSKSLRILGKGKIGIQHVQKPYPTGDEVLVKVVACGQNPLDVAVLGITAYVPEFADFYNGNTIGCDFSGIVEAVGPLTTRFRPGDRIGGFLPGNLQEQGAFAEYLIAEESFAVKLSDDVTFEQAATLGVAASTAAIALHHYLGVPRYRHGAKPFGQYILVNGGSSATGTMAIQIAKLSGAKVIVLASPKNFELVRSYGADKVFDYHNPDVAALIKNYSNNGVELVVNCVSTRETCKLICQCMAPQGGKCVNLVPVDTSAEEFRKDVHFSLFMSFQVFNKTFALAYDTYPPSKALRDLLKDFWQQLGEELLPGKFIKFHPVKIIQGGLGGVLETHQQMHDAQVSGWKYVARIADTQEISE